MYPRTRYEVEEPEVVVKPASITVTLDEQQYHDLRTLIMRDTFGNHSGGGFGPLGDNYHGPFGEQAASRMGDHRGNKTASCDETSGPL